MTDDNSHYAAEHYHPRTPKRDDPLKPYIEPETWQERLAIGNEQYASRYLHSILEHPTIQQRDMLVSLLDRVGTEVIEHYKFQHQIKERGE